MKYYPHTVRGFTLIEVLVSMLLFSVTAVLVIGSFLSILDANRKVRSASAVTNELNLVLERISRDIRDGEGLVACTSGSSCTLVNRDGDPVRYYLHTDGTIYYESGAATTPLTSDAVTVTALAFSDAASGGGVVIALQGAAEQGTKDVRDFAVQTVVTPQLALGLPDAQVLNTLDSIASIAASTPSVVSDPAAESTVDAIPGSVLIQPNAAWTVEADQEYCPWANGVLLADGWKVLDVQHGKGTTWTTNFFTPTTEFITSTPALSRQGIYCDPDKKYSSIVSCTTGTTADVANIAGIVSFRTTDVVENIDPNVLDRNTTAICQLSEIGASSIVDVPVGGLALPAGPDYEVLIALNDQHHCLAWDVSGTCIDFNTETQPGENVRVNFLNAAGAVIASTGYSGDLPDARTMRVSPPLPVTLPDERVYGFQIELRGHQVWNETYMRPNYFDDASALKCANLTPLGSATYQPYTSHPELNDYKGSVGVGCIAIAPAGSTYPAAADTCPIGTPEVCDNSFTSKCRPSTDYECCVGSSGATFCPTGTCSADGNTCTGIGSATCAADETTIVDGSDTYCVPPGGFSCVSVGLPGKYCPSTHQYCAPDGQCFDAAGASMESVIILDQLDSEEF